ncbi:MAG: hypothetical protein D6761_09010 [Candidatus Dadabacteria bacterium]|nr:MAG: hypothetical protein D6761_09010 [Candidatus Dadabacteria bacterium]
MLWRHRIGLLVAGLLMTACAGSGESTVRIGAAGLVEVNGGLSPLAPADFTSRGIGTVVVDVIGETFETSLVLSAASPTAELTLPNGTYRFVATAVGDDATTQAPLDAWTGEVSRTLGGGTLDVLVPLSANPVASRDVVLTLTASDLARVVSARLALQYDPGSSDVLMFAPYPEGFSPDPPAVSADNVDVSLADVRVTVPVPAVAGFSAVALSRDGSSFGAVALAAGDGAATIRIDSAVPADFIGIGGRIRVSLDSVVGLSSDANGWLVATAQDGDAAGEQVAVPVTGDTLDLAWLDPGSWTVDLFVTP